MDNKSRKGQIIKDILLAVASVAVVGIAVAAAIAAPNAIGAFGGLMRQKRYSKSQINRGLSYLKAKKIIGVGKDACGNTVIKLTEAGKEKLIKYKIEEMVLQKPKKWDKKWRIVMFDIPEEYKVNRDTLSGKLKQLGFYRMQKSAWIWPYSVEDEITFLKEVYEIRPFVNLITAERVENEIKYLKYFGLLRT